MALCFDKQCLVVGYSDLSRMRFPQIEIHFSKTLKAILFLLNEGELDLRSIRCSHEWLMLRAEGSALLDHAESLMQSWGKVNVFCGSELPICSQDDVERRTRKQQDQHLGKIWSFG